MAARARTALDEVGRAVVGGGGGGGGVLQGVDPATGFGGVDATGGEVLQDRAEVR